ncbi:MAG: hypothetical protein PHV37_08480 [Candidatus Gastranaerophilales bacterium]|nr:hypothetical protein [Candidatus Gastranaerophilales bacterium]
MKRYLIFIALIISCPIANAQSYWDNYIPKPITEGSSEPLTVMQINDKINQYKTQSINAEPEPTIEIQYKGNRKKNMRIRAHAVPLSDAPFEIKNEILEKQVTQMRMEINLLESRLRNLELNK